MIGPAPAEELPEGYGESDREGQPGLDCDERTLVAASITGIPKAAEHQTVLILAPSLPITIFNFGS